MCPHRTASLFTLTSSRRFSPVAYIERFVPRKDLTGLALIEIYDNDYSGVEKKMKVFG
jgi:hypothetical protein